METKVSAMVAEMAINANEGHEHWGQELSLYDLNNVINRRIAEMPRKNSSVASYTYKSEAILSGPYKRLEVWKYDVKGDRNYLLLTVKISQ